MQSIMYKYLIMLIIFILNNQVFPQKMEVYMPDGQLISRHVRIYISDTAIVEEMKPCLRFLLINKTYTDKLEPIEIAQDQTYKIPESLGTSSGTLLIFNIPESILTIPYYKSCTRVCPIIEWIEKANQRKIVSEYFIVLGNGFGAVFWTIIIFLIFIFISLVITWTDEQKIWGLIRTVDGTVSMSLFQMALWTIVIGLMVLAYGLLQLRVPNIPQTLIWLMVFSSFTTVSGRWQALRADKKFTTEKKVIQAIPSAEISKIMVWRSLFYQKPPLYVKEGNKYVAKYEEDPSLAKAQIFFWTLTTLIIFLVNSILQGQLWDIPEELVFLMGVSQATYLGGKELSIFEISKK